MNEPGINPKNSVHSDEVSLKDIIIKIHRGFAMLLSKWLIIMLAIIIGSTFGLIYSFSKSPSYIASTSFVLEEGNSGGGFIGGLGGLASMVGLDVGAGGGIFQGDNIVELYKSRTMIQRTLLTSINFDGKKQLLVERYIEHNKLLESWKDNPRLNKIDFKKNENFTRLQDSVLGVIVEDIRTRYLSVGKPDKKLSIISAEVKSTDESFAMEFNRAIVENVSNFYINTKTKKSLENVVILQQKVDSVRAVMDGAIYSAASVVDATPNLNPTRQLQRTAPVQRSQFSAETNKSILGELVKNLELSKMSLRKETPLIQVLDEPVYPLVKIRFGKMKGLILGGLIGFMSICTILVVRRLYIQILS
ncbi:hypothetical protein ACVWYN_000118 [Pedobacter sp. UYP24]